jgi:hypothetical protein
MFLRSSMIAPMILSAASLLTACANRQTATPSYFSLQGDYDAIASCVYRHYQDEPDDGLHVSMTRLRGPDEIRLTSETTAGFVRNAGYWAWEAAFRPAEDGANTGVIIRSANADRWLARINPVVTGCGSVASR